MRIYFLKGEMRTFEEEETRRDKSLFGALPNSIMRVNLQKKLS